ncbi:MAG: NADH-quinone oxidoreductase subunit H [Dehalococcoidia bacterium]|nr:NADH-quinone oxidoreductase subunit H [Dehalococcoidia bacterium]
MTGTAESIVLGVAQIVVVVAVAPLFQGLIRKLKARFQSRNGPPLLQSYYDLGKLFSRGEMVADTASVIQLLAPWIVLGAVLSATLFVPMFAAATPLTRDGDLLLVVGLFALARLALTLGGMDSGSSLGQMGSSRELAVGALVEPAFLVSLGTLAIAAGTTQMAGIVVYGGIEGLGFVDLAWGLALLGFGIVTLAETGRIPVDNPDTHLELTMIHEAMLIEYSGRSLGVLHLATMVKQLLLACLMASLFFPFGLDQDPAAASYVAGAGLLVVKVATIGLALAIVESAFAKLRMYELPDLIGSASLVGLVALAITVWQV